MLNLDDNACQAIRERTLQRRKERRLVYEHLDGLAQGTRQPAIVAPQGDINYLSTDKDLLDYHGLYQKNMGHFCKHFAASIPLFLEEQCRIGVTLNRLSESLEPDSQGNITFFESGGCGCNGRTLAQFSEGRIKTLATSSSIFNQQVFDRSGSVSISSVCIGIAPFCLCFPVSSSPS